MNVITLQSKNDSIEVHVDNNIVVDGSPIVIPFIGILVSRLLAMEDKNGNIVLWLNDNV